MGCSFDNSDKLTKAAAMQVIRQATGLTGSEIPEGEKIGEL
jgi:hypothetical protein